MGSGWRVLDRMVQCHGFSWTAMLGDDASAWPHKRMSWSFWPDLFRFYFGLFWSCHAGLHSFESTSVVYIIFCKQLSMILALGGHLVMLAACTGGRIWLVLSPELNALFGGQRGYSLVGVIRVHFNVEMEEKKPLWNNKSLNGILDITQALHVFLNPSSYWQVGFHCRCSSTEARKGYEETSEVNLAWEKRSTFSG